MATILDLFKNKGSYKYGTVYSNVKADKQNRTTIDIFSGGVRQTSGADFNNPRIYGNEATRISLRSTPSVEDQKAATGGEGGDGGLLGKGLSGLTGGKVNSFNDVRDKVNKLLGIPQNLYPTKIVTNSKFIKGEEQDTIITLAEIRNDAKGSLLGQFLKDTGGGNFRTIGKQALGNGIGKVKDGLRSTLVGQPQTIGELTGEKAATYYGSAQSYTKVLKDNRDYKKEGGPADEFTGIDISLVSPVSGLNRKDQDGRFGLTEYAFRDPNNSSGRVQEYSPVEPYTGVSGDPQSATLEDRGIGGLGVRINGLGPSDEYTKDQASKLDLITFWVSSLDSSKPVFFQTLITGLTETVSPSWSGEKFVGNPYSFYKYEGVERSISFGLQIYCMNPLELATSWEKIEWLSSKAYPRISKKLVIPPLIKFRLGDIYREKIGFIESLSYTIPDNANWETDIEGLKLPKFIDASITIKFIENVGAESSLYSYAKGADAINEINEYLSETAQSFDGEPVTGEGAESSGNVDEYGTRQEEAPTEQGTSGDGKGGADATPKNGDTGKSNSSAAPKNQYKSVTDKQGSNKYAEIIKEREAELLNQGYPLWAANGLARESANGIDEIRKLSESAYYYSITIKINEREKKYEKAIRQTSYGYTIEQYKTWVKRTGSDPIYGNK